MHAPRGREQQLRKVVALEPASCWSCPVLSLATTLFLGHAVSSGLYGCQEEGPDIAVGARSHSERYTEERDQRWGDAPHSRPGQNFLLPFIPFRTAWFKKKKRQTGLRRTVKSENIRRINAKAIPAPDCGYDTEGCISLRPGVR